MGRIAWLDLETTGLDALKDDVLEIACVVTDDKLVEIARLHLVTDAARHRDLQALPLAVQNMHHMNGLWMESLRSAIKIKDAACQLRGFLQQHAHRATLGGSTPSFDRAFVEALYRQYILETDRDGELLSHRHVDSSTLSEVARVAWPAIYAARPQPVPGAAHRATPDIEYSIALVRYYTNALGVRVEHRETVPA